MRKQQRPYGTWPGVISPAMVAGTLGLNDVQWDDDGETIVWLEGRSDGRVLVAQTGTENPRDLTESDLKIRARVGYGGGEFTVGHGQVIFVAGGRLYSIPTRGGRPRPITPAFGQPAAPTLSPDGQWVVFVHTDGGVDGLALVDVKGDIWPRKLAYGTDFVTQPAWSPNSDQIAYIVWNHPQMSWVGTELRLVNLAVDGSGVPYATGVETLTGDTQTAISQPEYSPDGRYLSYISDQSGFGQIYLYDREKGTHRQLTTAEAEHGTPIWVQGIRLYGWTGDSRALLYLRLAKGFYSVWRVDVESGESTRVTDLDHYGQFDRISVAPTHEAIATIASASDISPRILTWDADNGERILRRSTTESIKRDDFAQAESITWTGHDGEPVYGLLYLPTSSRFEGIGKPPLIVNVHGGPTSHRAAGYESRVPFFTSRGFAVLQVNHRGSTGYGRAYMDKHNGGWGVYDVEDSVTGAQHLADSGRIDPDKVVIMGGSAGGYTVLKSLVDHPGFYKAGVCSYGISNLFLLDMETHKFESHYNDWLLGPLPDTADIWRERSPIFHADNIQDALLIFQGDEDNVVPKNQSDAIVESLKARGVTHEYHVYEGEGHGFRKPETIEHYYETTLRFLLVHVVYG